MNIKVQNQENKILLIFIILYLLQQNFLLVSHSLSSPACVYIYIYMRCSPSLSCLGGAPLNASVNFFSLHRAQHSVNHSNTDQSSIASCSGCLLFLTGSALPISCNRTTLLHSSQNQKLQMLL